MPQGAVLAQLLFNAARQRIQLHLQKLLPWYDKWKIGINANKCDAVVISRNSKNIQINIPININNVLISPSPSIKYLGVVVDRRLIFHHHVSRILGTAFVAGQKLYPLLNQTSPFSPANKLLLYQQVIRPVLTYLTRSPKDYK